MADKDSYKTPTGLLQDSYTPIAALSALLPGGFLGWHMGWPIAWPGLLLPLSVVLFTFVWIAGLARYVGRWWALGSGLILGAVLAHLVLWLPFLLVSYIGGQGAGRADYSVPAALFTAAAVAWYVLGAYFWQTLALLAALTALVFVWRALNRHRKEAG